VEIVDLASESRGSGTPLVLLHAFPLSSELWEKLEPPQGIRLVLPDFPGFGHSTLAPPGWSLQDAARALEKHLENRGLKGRIHLGGISMGGYWAMEFIRQFPERVDKALFISTRPGVDKPEGRQNRLNMAERVEEQGTEFLVGAMVPGLLGKTTLADKPKVKARVGQWILEANPRAVALAQRAMADRRDQTGLMSILKARTLIVAGREDILIPATEAEAMAKAIPDNRLELLDGVGHLVPIEDPVLFQKTLDSFLSGTK
jgi:pimeloyl-ACP methyl ester carboxylesterase